MHAEEGIAWEALPAVLEARMVVPRRLLGVGVQEGSDEATVLVRTWEHLRIDGISRCLHWDFEKSPLHGLWVSADWACLVERDRTTGRLAYTEPWLSEAPPGAPPRSGLRLHALLQPSGVLHEGTLWWSAKLRVCDWDACVCTRHAYDSEEGVVDHLRLTAADGGLKLRIALLTARGAVRGEVLCSRDESNPRCSTDGAGRTPRARGDL